ncbi:uncharacterized protein N7469_008935 [Penicillium citrinum]|uniref:Monopolin complex subunit Csm1/Pcs1 C-terminal domain-containing protein n=1 Tax=Penicillium citrinum TaxID=5077 RepID=A0A9W9TIN7_PENCI|nr:uncharacterized protein N7469_008935 [Penicillium citrinum]KAJ5222695.1 hypothetical protein N7469_008935 [Penicillium citrinum]KAK5788542.1 hypothetical protein VI817_009500 [Penicillium citrinum]
MPKRKAPAKLSGFVESDDDDLMQLTRSDSVPQDQDHGQEAHDEHPSKKRRGRPRTSNESTTETKPPARSTRQNSVQPGGEEAPKKTSRRGRPRGSSQTSDNAAGPARASASKELVGSQEAQDNENEKSVTAAGVKAPRITRSGKPAATRGRGRGRTASVARPSVTDGDFEYTPTRAHHTQKDAGIPDTQMQDALVTDAQVEESILPDPQPNARHAQSSIIRNSKTRVSSMRTSQDPSPPKRKSITAEQGGDPELRRRIGDLTRKNDMLESKYRDLREIGVEEAKTNMEKLRKQCEGITIASDKLVSSLKSELAAQKTLGQQSRTLQKQLKDRDAEVAQLKIQAEEAESQLSSAQSEIKALQTKLAAARNTAAGLESAVKAPGSAIKGGAANRAAAAVTAEVAQSAQIAQLKEDLYSDLTGLIIRDVKSRDEDHLYDCIQTGVNGTLHFKLVIPKTTTGPYEKAIYQYIPLLDANRDRDLVDILPDFLMDHITFERQAVTKFYTRVIDALTKRRASSS